MAFFCVFCCVAASSYAGIAMLSFLRSFPCGTSGKEVRQVAEVGEEGNGDIAEDNDDDGMDQGNGNTALEHFIGIQAIADRHGTDTDGQEPLGVEGHTGHQKCIPYASHVLLSLHFSRA